MEIEAFVHRYPRLYHMAESGTWPRIRTHGLLSTRAVLKQAGLPAAQLEASLRAQRPEKESVAVPGVGEVILRDQKPMDPDRLATALRGSMPPSDWYELINSRVFFWAQEHRLLGLLGAREYRVLEHDVLTVDTASLLHIHAKKTWICHMNSGNTYPIPHFRGLDTFQRIPDYPVSRTGRPRKEVVELTIEGEVLDIADHVIRVERMRGAEVLGQIPLK